MLFSVHAWPDDEPHDVLLNKALTGWQVISVAREPLDHSATPRQRLERWLTRAVDTIDTAQPAGPLHLIGWSLGAKMAYLVAQRLNERGRTVAFCGVVDALGEWPGIGPVRVGAFVHLVRAAPTNFDRWNVVRRGPISRIRWRFMWWLSLLVPRSRRDAVRQARPNGEVARYLNPTIAANWRIASVLALPRSTTVPVTSFVTPSSLRLYRSPDLWWSPVVGDGVSVMAIRGTHSTLFDAGNLEALVIALEHALPDAGEATKGTTTGS